MTIDTNRLRDLARHQFQILGENVEDSLIWKAADEIEGLREALKPFADLDEQTKPMFDSIVGKEAQAHELEAYVNLYAIRTARAKLEGSGE